MNITPENVPDESLIQVKVVRAQLLIKTNTQNIVHEILDIYMVGLENTNNAGWRIQTSSTIGHGGTLFRKNFGNFQISPTKR